MFLVAIFRCLVAADCWQKLAASAALSGGHASLTGQLSPAESADLDLPEQAPVDPHVPAFANHAIARQPWHYHSSHPAARGVFDGLRHFGFIEAIQ